MMADQEVQLHEKVEKVEKRRSRQRQDQETKMWYIKRSSRRMLSVRMLGLRLTAVTTCSSSNDKSRKRLCS